MPRTGKVTRTRRSPSRRGTKSTSPENTVEQDPNLQASAPGQVPAPDAASPDTTSLTSVAAPKPGFEAATPAATSSPAQIVAAPKTRTQPRQVTPAPVASSPAAPSEPQPTQPLPAAPVAAPAPAPAPYVPPVREPIYGEGLLEVSDKGYGFLRDASKNYEPTKTDIFVLPDLIRHNNLREGLVVRGEIIQSNKGPQLRSIQTINGEPVEKYKNLVPFEQLTTINPNKRFVLETRPEILTTRVIDLMTPIGKGQRGLIVAPPRTGKTTLLQHIANALTINHPDVHLMVLLVDERPEEVTEVRRNVKGEVIASSNDMNIQSHVRISQIAMEKAKRMVEMGKDVFILLDSLTRLGRAFNNNMGNSGRTLSGGMDARGMEIPRKIFAAARNTEEAGSLTIVASALIDTGSRMDELIFQEFKGTGNMELVLDRKLADNRIFPAVDIAKSGTRREELLIPPHELEKINKVRRGLTGHSPEQAMERLLSFLEKHPNNAAFLRQIP